MVVDSLVLLLFENMDNILSKGETWECLVCTTYKELDSVL